jgi:carbamoyl-phosphate synthase/aspartate carbamoyltransferase
MGSPHKRVPSITGSPIKSHTVLPDKSPRARLFSDPNTGVRFEGAVKSRLQSSPLTVPSYSRMATPTFSKKHITSVNQFQRSDLHILFGVAQEMKLSVEKQGNLSMLAGKVMCSAFWEPSTRTSCSFETAMVRLGGSVVSINQITSSISKGESLSDTGKFISDIVRTLATYGDVIVMRHPMAGSADVAKQVSAVPVINAGDGIGEHPTQALLDIYTIREELGTVNGLTITFVGDLLNGSTVHSLVKLISLYSVKINYVSPKSLSMPKDIIDLVGKYGISQYETSDLASVIPQTDVLYVTRIQKERFESEEAYNLVKDSYKITNSVLKRAKDHMIGNFN